MRPLGIVLRGRFLFVTTYESNTGLLLIETFRKTKLWPPGFDPWEPFLYVRGSQNFGLLPIPYTPNNARGKIVMHLI
jgi:hypothetical protein